MNAHVLSPPRALPSLTWRVAPFVVGASVIGLLLIFLGAGWLLGQWAFPDPSDISMRRINHLELSFTQGYLDGSHQGRILAERGDASLDSTAVTHLVDSSLESAGPQLAARGPDYARGFREGMQAGVNQRMTERFGPPGARVAATPRPMVAVQVAPAAAPTPQESPTTMGGIKCIKLPDGSVEYTNL